MGARRYTQLKGIHRSVEVYHPKLKVPHQSVGVHHHNERGRAEAWESVTRAQAATMKRGIPSVQLEVPH